jgi:uncharacterized membrane protein (DUF485 family)
MSTIITWAIIIALGVAAISYVLSHLLFLWLNEGEQEVDHLDEYFKNLHKDGE